MAGTLVVTASLCASVGSTLGIVMATFLYQDQFDESGVGNAKVGW